MNYTLNQTNVYNPKYKVTQSAWQRLEVVRVKMAEKERLLRDTLYRRYQKQFRPQAEQDQQFIDSMLSQYDQEDQKKNKEDTTDEVVVKSESDMDLDDMDPTMDLQGSNVFFGFKSQLRRYREIVNVIGDYLSGQIAKSTFKGDKGLPGELGDTGKC